MSWFLPQDPAVYPSSLFPSFPHFGGGHLGILLHIFKDWPSPSVFFTLEEKLMGKRMGTTLPRVTGKPVFPF